MRNISCTLLPSKVYESYVLNWLQEEVKCKINQYRGVRGCSTSHLQVQVMDDIGRILEDDRAAALLMSIDYVKAFNRLSFQHCLRAFARKEGGQHATAGHIGDVPQQPHNDCEGGSGKVGAPICIRRGPPKLHLGGFPFQRGHRQP